MPLEVKLGNSFRKLQEVSIERGITNIGDGAFYQCTNLTTINIPDSVICIGSKAFTDTAWFNNQPDGLIYVGKVAYSYK